MLTSPQINELAAALSKAQGAMKGAVKDSSNPHFKSKYADLSSVWDACRKVLAANGLSVIQTPEESERQEVRISTTLLHSSGQWITSTYAIPVTKADAQGYGSAITYARRYSLAAMVGVAPEDDDGNAASKAAPASAVITDAQVSQIIDLLESSNADKARFLKHFRAGSVEQIRATDYANAVAALTKKLEQANG